jgi:hypothetical protein
MFVRRIDGAISRALRALSAADALGRYQGPGAAIASRLSTAGLLDSGLELARRCAGWLGSRRDHGPSHMRWLELQNKIAAYRLFEGRDLDGQPVWPDQIGGFDPYSRLFAAEGYAYRRARSGALELQSASEFRQIAMHAGAGLWIAERTLEQIDSRRCQSAGALSELFAQCRCIATDGFAGIMEEALGLVARTLYPHLMNRLDEHAGAISPEFRERFWHGVGRGIYFAPSNMVPFRALPWRGVAMCSREARDETAIENALSGFGFALALVNLRQPEMLRAFFDHHAAEAAGCADGVRSAMAVWELSGGDPEATGPLPACGPSERVALIRGTVDLAAEELSRPERLFSSRRQERNPSVITASREEMRE